MAIAPNQPIHIGTQVFYSRTCQYQRICQNFDDRLTIPVALSVKGVPVGATQKLNKCMTGGGCACSDFVKLNTMERY